MGEKVGEKVGEKTEEKVGGSLGEIDQLNVCHDVSAGCCLHLFYDHPAPEAGDVIKPDYHHHSEAV